MLLYIENICIYWNTLLILENISQKYVRKTANINKTRRNSICSLILSWNKKWSERKSIKVKNTHENVNHFIFFAILQIYVDILKDFPQKRIYISYFKYIESSLKHLYWFSWKHFCIGFHENVNEISEYNRICLIHAS